MTDRYEKIREALAMELTPGSWYLSGEGIRALVRDANGVIVAAGHRLPGHKNESVMRLIAACDPDTSRALLEERDAQQVEIERLREVLKDADNELDWLDGSIGPCDRSYWNMRRKMKAALSKKNSDD